MSLAEALFFAMDELPRKETSNFWGLRKPMYIFGGTEKSSLKTNTFWAPQSDPGKVYTFDGWESDGVPG